MPRKHPALEGLRHSLEWIWQRIEPMRYGDGDREALLTWLRELAKKVENKDRDV